MAEPIRVLQVMGKMNRGGAEAVIMELYRHVDRNIVQFDFVEHTEERCFYDDEIEKMGGRIYRVPRYCGYNHFAYLSAWNALFRDHPEYKVAHCHIRSTASLICKIAKDNGVKTIAHSHNTSDGRGVHSLVKKLYRGSLSRRADYLWACSREAGRWLFGAKAVQGSNYRLFPNAIDTERFRFSPVDRSSARAELGVDDSTVVFGNVARFHPQKNHLFLIDLFAAILKRQPNAILVLVGEGELRSEIEQRIQSHGIENRVKLLGVRSDIPRLMSAFDMFLFPSKWEGLPVTIVEAQANGLPCLVSDTVTKDVNLTDLVRNLPITQGVEAWVDGAMNTSMERKDCIETIRAAGFDINCSATTLTDFYKSIF